MDPIILYCLPAALDCRYADEQQYNIKNNTQIAPYIQEYKQSKKDRIFRNSNKAKL